MRIKFILGRRRNTNKGVPQYLEAYIYDNGKKLYRSVGLKLLLEDWDARNQRVIRRPDKDKINEELATIRNMLEIDPTTTISVLEIDKDRYDSFNNYFDRQLSREFKLAISTYIDQKRTLALLNEFGMINFDQVNVKFLENFDRFLSGKRYARSTIAKHHKNVEKFLNRAIADHFITINPYDSFSYEKWGQQFSIYLSIDELKRMMNAPGLTEHERIVKDIFMVSAFTALRYSDVIRLDRSYLSHKGDIPLIKIITHKTNEFVVIPANPIVMQIFDYYNGFPQLKGKSNSYFNMVIKTVAQKAGIDDPVNYVMIRDGERETILRKKYEMVTMHTGRRSGATNMFLAGIPAINIMKITGHTTETSFMKYILIDKERNAEILSENPFFKNPFDYDLESVRQVH